MAASALARKLLGGFYSKCMAATCSYSSGCKWPQGAVGPQVAASGATGESGVAASGGRKWSQVAASSCLDCNCQSGLLYPTTLEKRENASKELKRKEEQKGGEELKRNEGSNESKERVATKNSSNERTVRGDTKGKSNEWIRTVCIRGETKERT